MKTRFNELGIGITMTVATLIVVLGILMLSKSNFLASGMRIELVVSNAEGIGVGDDVFFRGMTAGSVQSLEMLNDGVLVVLKLHGEPKIAVDSKFSIRDAGLLGGKAVEIDQGKSTSYLATNARVRGVAQPGLFSGGGGTGGQDIQSQLNSILSNIDSLSGETTLKNLYSLIDSLNSTSRSLQDILDQNRDALHQTVNNLQELSGDSKEPVRQTVESANATIQNIDAATSQLETVIAQTNQTVEKLDVLLTDIQQGKGTLGKLVTDDTLYNNMKDAIAQFDGLVADIKKNPQKYVTVKLF